jgi:hypothetical protein
MIPDPIVRCCYVCQQDYVTDTTGGPPLCDHPVCRGEHGRRRSGHRVHVDLDWITTLREKHGLTWAEVRVLTGHSVSTVKLRFKVAGRPLPKRCP